MRNMFGAEETRESGAYGYLRDPQRATKGLCYNVHCQERNNYKGAWSCTNCYLCVGRKLARQSRREGITI